MRSQTVENAVEAASTFSRARAAKAGRGGRLTARPDDERPPQRDWTLHERGILRFGELERMLGVTPKVLTQRLRQLERDGLVVRTHHPEIPPRVEYEISELGESLAAVFAALTQWSEQHLSEVQEARAAYTGPLPR
jgi:DNA-binding HxlR family transcriptional regulator